MKKSIHIYILNYQDAMLSAIHGVHDILSIANNQADQEIFVVSELKTTVFAEKGIQKIIFVPPSLTNQLPQFSDPNTLSLLRKSHEAGAVVTSACAGVFWLANAGLLKGKCVTTHWALYRHLTDAHPEISEVCSKNMVVDQGDIITAAGLYAFQDLVLHMIARFYGERLARKVASFCLLDFNTRVQSYYQRFYPDVSHGNSAIINAQQFCAKHLHEKVSIADIAEFCCLSERTLSRQFRRVTGFSPKQYMIQLKIEKAKQLLELEKVSVDEVGYQLGYADTSNFIKIFKKIAGITPAEFRNRQVGEYSPS